jgi:hypothetical protein
MKLSEIPDCLKEVLALYDILLGIGYDNDNLYMKLEPDGIDIAILANDTFYPIQATKVSTLNQNDLIAQWKTARTSWNESSQDERDELVNHTTIRQHAVFIIAWLAEKKIMPALTFDLDCPFCGKKVSADTVSYSLSHLEPTCEKFNTLDVLGFRHEAQTSVEVN